MDSEQKFLLETLLKYDILKVKAEQAGIRDLDKFLDNYKSCSHGVNGDGYYFPASICVPSSRETVELKVVRDIGHEFVSAHYDSRFDIWYSGTKPVEGRIVGWKPIDEPAILLAI